MNYPSASRMPYAESVPAARRAMSALEHLARTPGGATLSELSRVLMVGPSSLLALLVTLRAGGYVRRGGGGRYGVDPGLVALGARAAACLEIGEAFDRAAARLRGESVSAEPRHAIVARAERADGSTASGLSAVELAAFLDEPLVAVLAYRNGAGYPSTVPVWYSWDEAAFWLLPGPGARWLDQLRRDPRVSLTVSEAVPPLRRVNAEAVAQVLDDAELAGRTQATLARRYEPDPTWTRAAAEVVRVDPTHLVSSRGLVPRVQVDRVA